LNHEAGATQRPAVKIVRPANTQILSELWYDNGTKGQPCGEFTLLPELLRLSPFF
jgi:hypothetical protein